jgi:hypothetical protein
MRSRRPSIQYTLVVSFGRPVQIVILNLTSRSARGSGSRALQPPEPRAVPGAGGPDAAADPEQRGRPVGAGEHDQAPVRGESARAPHREQSSRPGLWSAPRKPRMSYRICIRMCRV